MGDGEKAQTKRYRQRQLLLARVPLLTKVLRPTKLKRKNYNWIKRQKLQANLDVSQAPAGSHNLPCFLDPGEIQVQAFPLQVNQKLDLLLKQKSRKNLQLKRVKKPRNPPKKLKKRKLKRNQ